MLFVYPAIFHKEDEAYWVEFPDLDGCHTYGSSINESMAAAQETLSAYLLTLLEQERAIASPSDISTIHVDDGFVFLVSCDIKQHEDDDELCEQLYHDYLNAKDKDEAYTLDECKREWAIDS